MRRPHRFNKPVRKVKNGKLLFVGVQQNSDSFCDEDGLKLITFFGTLSHDEVGYITEFLNGKGVGAVVLSGVTLEGAITAEQLLQAGMRDPTGSTNHYSSANIAALAQNGSIHAPSLNNLALILGAQEGGSKCMTCCKTTAWVAKPVSGTLMCLCCRDGRNNNRKGVVKRIHRESKFYQNHAPVLDHIFNKRGGRVRRVSVLKYGRPWNLLYMLRSPIHDTEGKPMGPLFSFDMLKDILVEVYNSGNFSYQNVTSILNAHLDAAAASDNEERCLSLFRAFESNLEEAHQQRRVNRDSVQSMVRARRLAHYTNKLSKCENLIHRIAECMTCLMAKERLQQYISTVNSATVEHVNITTVQW